MACAIMQACIYVYYSVFINTMIFTLNFMVATTTSGKLKSHPNLKAKTGPSFRMETQ